MISVIIAATSAAALERTLSAYEREGGELELLFYEGPDAWQRGCAAASGSHLHLTSDIYEPHPGWSQAALAASAAGFVPAPVLWRPSGERVYEHDPDQDWQPAGFHSRIPFFLRGVGTLLPAAVRCDYAFTQYGTESS